MAEPLAIEVQNHLDKCVTVSNSGLTYHHEIPLLELAIKPISETGACGCKSAVSHYSVYSSSDAHEHWIMSGNFTFLGRENLQLPIAAQKHIIGNTQKIKITMDCSKPS